jgi:hypothetical protein
MKRTILLCGVAWALLGATQALAVQTVVTGIQVATANDGIGFREPETYSLWGTNDVINHASVTVGGSDNGSSQEYNWTLISEGPFTGIPATTNTLYPVVNFANSTPYSSYRVVFPQIGATGDSGCCMQVAEIRLLNAGGTNILSPTDGVSAFQIPIPFSDSPDAEESINLTDLDPMTKYLNFGKEGSGVILTPSVGPKIISGLEITTANDAEGRDPASFQLFGTNDPITSAQHSTSNPENWTLVTSGSLSLPATRLTSGGIVPVSGGSTAYSSYRLIFPTLKDTFGGGVDSMQISELQLYDSLNQPVLQFGEQPIAVDIIANSRSSYPGGENPPKAIDGIIPPSGSTTGNKYLNFARFSTGIMVTPTVPEPGTMAMALVALVAGCGVARRR